MGREGFEPPKRSATDLQSVPVDHLGICPIITYQTSNTGPDFSKTYIEEIGTTTPILSLKNFTEDWSWREASNPRPADYKSAALPTELRQRFYLTH